MSTCFQHLEDDSFLFTFHGLFRRLVSLVQGFLPVFIKTALRLLLSFLSLSSFAEAGAVLAQASPEEIHWATGFLGSEKFFDQTDEQKAIFEKKKILTSTKLKDQNHWKFKAEGKISAPSDFCLASAKDFGRLRKIPERFPEVLWNSESSELWLQVKFLGQTRALVLKLSEAPATSEKSAAIFFHSIGPWMKGLEGVVQFKDLGRQETESRLLAKYSGHLRWVPDFVFSFASEAVVHHVALSLRKSLESDYKDIQLKTKTN